MGNQKSDINWNSVNIHHKCITEYYILKVDK